MQNKENWGSNNWFTKGLESLLLSDYHIEVVVAALKLMV